MRFLLVAAIGILYSISSYCTTIKGRLITADGKGVPAANVLLVTVNNTLAKADLSTEDGHFSLPDIAAGRYVLKIAAAGIADYSSDTINVAGSDIILPDIIVQLKTKTLNEVTISAQKPLIEIKADKLVVNVENSIVNTGSSVFEVLGRSPGVMIDNSDNINLKGRPGVTIMMNGKIMPVGGTDLASILKGMPSSAIERIEIISNPGARYDAAGSGGIINIITKKEKNKGLNGVANATYGQGVYAKLNGGVNLNYRNNKLNVTLNYNHADRKGFGHLAIDRQFYVNEELRTTYTQSNRTYWPVKNHSGSMAVDYSFTRRTTAGVSLTGNNSRFNPLGNNTSRVDSGSKVTFFNTTYSAQDFWNNYSVNCYVKHAFDTLGKEMNIDLDYARYWNHNNQLYTTKYYNDKSETLIPDYLLHGDLNGITQIRSAKIDYSHPLKSGLRIDAGIKSSYVTADNKPFFYDQSSGIDIFDPFKSNHFIYDENINAAYVNAAKDWKKWSTQLGLRGEQTIAKGTQKITGQQFTRRYAQLFPSLAAQYHATKNSDYGITLSRRIDRPGYHQLNPFKYFYDPTNYRMGNPYLNPTLTYAVEISYTFKQRFITTFTTSKATNVITETLEADETFPNISKQTDKNLEGMDYYGLSIAWPLQITKWWQNTVNGNVYYSYYRGTLSNTPLNKGRYAFDMNSTSSITLPKGLSAEVGLYYQSPMIFGYYDLIPVWNVNAGVQKKLFKNKATAKIGVTDIFWTNRTGATIEFANFREVWKSTRDSRVLNCTLIYRFGKTTNNTKRHSSGAEEEKRRVGNGG